MKWAQGVGTRIRLDAAFAPDLITTTLLIVVKSSKMFFSMVRIDPIDTAAKPR